MFGNIELFRLSQAMATHASTRLGVIAKNVANADTPGYRGQDTVAFTPDLDRAQASASMRQTTAWAYFFSFPQFAGSSVTRDGAFPERQLGQCRKGTTESCTGSVAA